MTAPYFVDTNVLVYADDRGAGVKRDRARELIRSAFRDGRARLSTQVLAEYFAAAIRKLGLTSANARRRVEIYAALNVFRPSADDLLAAIDLHRLHELSIWDALIVRSARASGCRVLYTEDLQHGRSYDGLLVVDPFRPE
ncbi:MAG: twitching motility protein PilT [Holophagae bacterium]|nr:MAG: twitching motility protein PilT [Holophagae bacterium]